jgi:hypothetical protein
VDDGVAKLERLGLLVRNAGLLSVPPLNEALAQLDRLWDGFSASIRRRSSVRDAGGRQIRIG